MTHFLDLKFKSFSLDQKEELEPFFKRYPQKLAIYTYAALTIWGQVYPFEWAWLGHDCLLVSTYIDEKDKKFLFQPLGNFTEELQYDLLKRLQNEKHFTKFVGVQNEFVQNHPEFCKHFASADERKMSNYLYKASDLAELKGRNYEKKRNLLSQAERLYEWKFLPITEKCKPYCPKILESVGAKEKAEMTRSLQIELKALDFLLTHFNELNQKCHIIHIDNKPVAFSIYEQLNATTAVVHFEKANIEYKGLYQLINRETAKVIASEGFEFINREEDMGIDGLRQAKLSYHPVELISSNTLKHLE